ncbi:type I-F CRISPR-associated protein Csy3 [Cereibacter sphaeroides]|uniref:type I-F CRISPR-associated protein Csy3 n=1 Tax=Cereibacter sphaeroides TaxID=1063 RepID=UPI001F22E1CE|nr:type I-F CRISPR-associated protein Csy3 [Cereibacter sphaeroides]MCE6958518.1 type I-F CRISPR-associated protein Csy3 [Cereibacter sphaeroides]MCE6972820.1 type I-F CRISPR-associated protein Csy3 [Cereibacter sphaeroides]
MNDMTSTEPLAAEAVADLRTGLETGMLAFARSLQISEGLFSARAGNDPDAVAVPVLVEEKGVRGQSAEDNAKNPGLSNPQVVDHACMPSGCSLLDLSFTLRVLPASAKVHASNSPVVAANYAEVARLYGELGGYRHLAALYVWNILNGRFAWRNRFQTDMATVTIKFAGYALTSTCLDLGLEEPAHIEEMASVVAAGNNDARAVLEKLIDGIAEGLRAKPFEADIVFTSSLKPGMEIWPSQEYIREEDRKDGKSRYYASLPCVHRGQILRQASMHSQKIGAAIRHIDIWHDNPNYGAIAVNPYGGVQETGEVLRSKATAPSFYDVRKKHDDLVVKLQAATSAAELDGSVHFFFSNLIRGGVFGGKDPAKAAEKAAAKKGKGK